MPWAAIIMKCMRSVWSLAVSDCTGALTERKQQDQGFRDFPSSLVVRTLVFSQLVPNFNLWLGN